MGIRLATFQQHQLTAQDYALLCAKSVSSGIFYGCNVTIKDESTLHVTSGVGIANGRTFDVTDDDYPVELTGGGSMVGRIYVHVDLADVDTPAQILVVKGATLPALVQDTDMNESTGVWDLELATFDVDASEISNLVYTASGVSGGGGGTMLAPYYDASEAWLKDQIFQKDGLLYKCLTDIAPGTPLVVDTNVKVTDFAEECEALNQNLTNCCVYNPTDDWIYIGNKKWKKAFFHSLVFFTSTTGYNSDDFGTIEEAYTAVGNCTCTGSTTINQNNIVFSSTLTSASDTQNGTGNFTSEKFVDLTAYSKLNIKGVANMTCNYVGYVSAYILFKIIDENNVKTQVGTTSILTYGTITSENINAQFDLTQYSGNYKLNIEIVTASSYVDRIVTCSLTANEIYFN